MISLIRQKSLLIQFATSTLLIMILWLKIDFQLMKDGIRSVPSDYFPAAIVLYALSQALSAIRWWVVAPFSSLRMNLITTFASQHILFIVPSGMTMDAIRTISARGETGSMSTSLAALAFDKTVMFFVGFLTILVCTMSDLSTLPSQQKDRIQIFAGVVLLLLALTVWVAVKGPVRKAVEQLLRLFGRPLPLVRVVIDNVAAIRSGMLTMFASCRLVSLNILTAVLLIVVNSLAYYWLFSMLRIPLTFVDSILVSVVLQYVMTIPLSFAGIGLKDLSFAVAVGWYGVTVETALVASLATYPVLIAFALLSWGLRVVLLR